MDLRLPGILLAVLVAAAGSMTSVPADERPAEGAEIRDLYVENRPGDLYATFALYGAFTPEIREQIESGLPVTFNHYVEVRRRRAAWFDGTLVKKTVSATVTYDTLTRQFRLSRSVNGDVIETTVSDKTAGMEDFMTRVERLRLCDPEELPGNRPLYLRVKSRVQKRFVFIFIPWNFDTSWARIQIPLSGRESPDRTPARP